MAKMVGTREHSTVLEGDRAGRSRARQPEVPVSSGGETGMEYCSIHSESNWEHISKVLSYFTSYFLHLKYDEHIPKLLNSLLQYDF